ncbi:Gfo/Idh/MocA family protein [Microbacterium murale]|uniref:Dehydrogenase n=1 Tax=Microbacterium murale TaxID=1081040 RepID=A0ABU0PB02_9MICO|nr:Gfo/Idh/MocA family oxidoreductase [Microbacterium murale]MDQ0644523.1 putative dehydrogenase [Microbacterium murale]
MPNPMRIGVIGVGKIAEQYFAELPKLSNLVLVAVADLNAARAGEVAREQGVEQLSVDALLTDDRIDAVLNLTIPAAHVEVGLRAIAAGKHVFAEKPLGLGIKEAAQLLQAADAAGLRVGSAPDTVLGTGVQTARNLLDDGKIGTPVGAAAQWTSPGHESWHPSPQFYYQPGGGPLFDMGPYYLTTLVTMFGPVISVAGSVSTSDRSRSVGTGPLQGTPLDVSIDTHVSAILFHESGVSSTITVSFDVWQSRAPKIEIYGTAGTISVADPNRFSDPTEVWTAEAPEWTVAPVSGGYADAGRGVGLADMARAIETGRPHRASGQLAFHVLEIMEAVLVAGRERRVVELTSTTERPESVPAGSSPDRW